MIARKKVVSIVCIISLIMALTVGIVLSAGSHTTGYVGDGISLEYTDVSVNPVSSTLGSEDKPAEAPSDAVAINNEGELKTFLQGSAAYGYLTADMDLTWSATGSNIGFAAGRTINGNGKTVTLKGVGGTANQYRDYFGAHVDFEGGMDYGLFVAYNEGTIKNFKFKYESDITVANDSGNLYPNYAGFICGTNATSGKILNCDLKVSGKLTYNYNNGQLGIDTYNSGETRARRAFSIVFGGVAGRNAGVISGITAEMNSFTGSFTATAANKTSIWQQRADARVYAGCISGTMYSKDSEISNVILTGSASISMSVKSNQNSSIGTTERAHRYAVAAAVVGANSSYTEAEGGIGDTESSQGKVDNIIMGVNMSYSGLGISKNSNTGDPGVTAPAAQSINAVVYCGKSSNITVLNTTNKLYDGNQSVDYQTDNCDCGLSENNGCHDVCYANVVNTGEHSDVELSIDLDGNQVISVSPRSTGYVLGELQFAKYSGRNLDATSESLQTTIDDNATYGDGVPKNDTTYLYNLDEAKVGNYIFKIAPYQTNSSNFWEITVYSYEIATISNADTSLVPGWSQEYVYNGFDFLTQQLKYTGKTTGNVGIADPSGFTAISTEDESVISMGKYPGDYSFTLQEQKGEVTFVSTANRVVAFASDTNGSVFDFKVKNADMQIDGYTPEWLANNWLSEVTNFEFQLIGGLENSATGYSYLVNGSLYTVSGLTMINSENTTGRSYTVYLTHGGIQVTNPLTYTVKIDREDPTVSIPAYEHPAQIYYTHNQISINAKDGYSGVASIMLYSYNKSTGALENTYNIIEECTVKATDKTYYDEATGYYVWYFKDTGRKVVEVTDNAGRKSSVELSVLIDTFEPTLELDVYYYKDQPSVDESGNPIILSEKTDYTSGAHIYHAVYFDATARFGESGGEIQYSLDGGATWNTYTERLVIKHTTDGIIFRAQSNTYDHPSYDTYPYNDKFLVTTYWGANGKDGSIPFSVVVELEPVTITMDDIIVTGATKTFDGTTKFLGEIKATDAFAAQINGDIIFNAEYVSVNASEEVAIKISASCTDDTKVLDSQIANYIGAIEKKEISIVIDSKDKYYGYSLPELTYTAYGMVAGFEEKIELYVVKGEGLEDTPYELLPQTERDANRDGYVITVVEGFTLINYVLPESNITIGKLHIDLAPVDRLVYEKGVFTGLDTANIAQRNLEIGFMRANGNYERLNVKFDLLTYEAGSGGGVREVYVTVTDMTRFSDFIKNPSSFYFVRVTVSLPDVDAAGELLTNKYEMVDSIKTFWIKVIEASIFEVEEEPEVEEVESEAVAQAPVQSAGSNSSLDVGIYTEGSSTNPDATNVAIEMPAKKNKDYLMIVSIFCAVAILIAFGIGIGRVVMKRARR